VQRALDNRVLAITHRQPATVRGCVYPEPMAQTREVWAHCPRPDGHHDATALGEALVPDSQWRERDTGECWLLRLSRENKVAAELLTLVAHA